MICLQKNFCKLIAKIPRTIVPSQEEINFFSVKYLFISKGFIVEVDTTELLINNFQILKFMTCIDIDFDSQK